MKRLFEEHFEPDHALSNAKEVKIPIDTNVSIDALQSFEVIRKTKPLLNKYFALSILQRLFCIAQYVECNRNRYYYWIIGGTLAVATIY